MVEHCERHEQNTATLAELVGGMKGIRWIGGGALTIAVFIVSAYMNMISGQLAEIRTDVKDVKDTVSKVEMQSALVQQRVEMNTHRIEVLEEKTHGAINVTR